MGSMSTYEWEREVLCDHGEYPGHPVVLGVMVMDRYHSFDHANQTPRGGQYYNAISDSFIPGSGCAVSSTMSVLKLGLELGAEAAFKEAERYWQGWEDQSPKNLKSAARGREQAEKMKHLFVQRLEAWKVGEVIDSKWRLPYSPSELV